MEESKNGSSADLNLKKDSESYDNNDCEKSENRCNYNTPCQNPFITPENVKN